MHRLPRRPYDGGNQRMFRVRIALVAALVVVAATAGVFVHINDTLSESIDKRVNAGVVRAHQQLLRASRLEGVDLATLTARFAREDEFVQIFSRTSEEERQRSAHVAVEVRNARLERDDGRKAGIIGVVDAEGLLVSRDLNPNWRYRDNFKKEFPSLALALTGTPNKDVWNLDGAMYRVGAAPIRGPQGQILGAVFVGYVQSVADAKAARELLGADVAYFLDGKIYASSFQQKAGSSSETAEEKALAAQLFEGPKLANKAKLALDETDLFRVRVGGQEFVAAAAPMPGNAPHATPSQSGFVVLSSLTEAKAQVLPLTTFVLLLGAVGILAALGAALMTARRFLVPLDKVEAGVSEVINGNHDYEFESPSEDFEGLANGLNVMLARLLGRPEPGEEDEDEEGESLRAME
jgi:hypothetical protein